MILHVIDADDGFDILGDSEHCNDPEAFSVIINGGVAHIPLYYCPRIVILIRHALEEQSWDQGSIIQLA